MRKHLFTVTVVARVRSAILEWGELMFPVGVQGKWVSLGETRSDKNLGYDRWNVTSLFV